MMKLGRTSSGCLAVNAAFIALLHGFPDEYHENKLLSVRPPCR